MGLADVDDDGVRDFAVGSTHYFGERGYIRIYSGVTRGLIRTIWGTVPLSRFGNTLAQAEDLDGDRVKDLLVGAPYASKGRVYAYSAASGALLWDVGPGLAGDRLGLSLAGFGDYDGDGIDDVLAGAPEAGGQAGKVYVLSGLDGATLDSFVGAESGDRLGASLALLEDLGGDAVLDFAVGVPGEDPPGRPQAGAVELRSGADLSLISRCNGPAAGASLGVALSGAGDTNLDGVPDLVAGAELVSGNGASQTGSAHVLSCQKLPLHTEDVLLSVTSGGRARFSLDAGASHGLRHYVVLASTRGAWPGVDVGLTHVPLNGSALTKILFRTMGSPMFRRFGGTLDANGQATALLDTLGPPDPALLGLKVHFAFVLLHPIDYASNAIPVEFVP